MHRLKSIEITSCLAALAAGVLLHFTYDWCGQSPWAAWLAPVNESTWEHLKLLFYPLLFISIAFILTGFYTYSGILGFTFLPVDIALFFGGVIVSFWYSYHYLKEGTYYTISNLPFFLLLAVIALAFILFTWLRPRIPLFAQP